MFIARWPQLVLVHPLIYAYLSRVHQMCIMYPCTQNMPDAIQLHTTQYKGEWRPTSWSALRLLSRKCQIIMPNNGQWQAAPNSSRMLQSICPCLMWWQGQARNVPAACNSGRRPAVSFAVTIYWYVQSSIKDNTHPFQLDRKQLLLTLGEIYFCNTFLAPMAIEIILKMCCEPLKHWMV